MSLNRKQSNLTRIAPIKEIDIQIFIKEKEKVI
jgi:hypothetical protein